MLWLYLHFPHLLLDHVRQSRAASTAQPPAPLVMAGRTSGQVVQACPLAQNQGVQAGMRLKTALSLAPDLKAVPSDSQREQQVLIEQARWLYRYAAQIVLYPPDGLLAEIGSLQRLYGGLSGIWKTLQQALADRQLHACMALGRTPAEARLCARAGQGQCSEDGRHLDDLLEGLPLEAVEFDQRTRQRLQRLGLTRLGEVFALPPMELARRLAPETLAYVQRIRGTRPDPQISWQPPHHFRQQADFAQDIEHAQGLLFPLQRMLTELEEDLRWRQQDTDSLLLLLTHRDQPVTRLRLRTAGPEHRAEAFLDLLRLRFEQHPLAAPVRSLVLVVRRFMPRDAITDQDLLGPAGNAGEAWHTLISRLQARLGDQALQQLSPQPDHRPERAWSASGVNDTDSRRLFSGSDRNQQTPTLPRRPLWLLKGPQPLLEAPVQWLAGPERISGGWWDGERVLRDYYIARLGTGQMAWVFREVHGGWFVHGWFG